jgi:periplasmic protein TonB
MGTQKRLAFGLSAMMHLGLLCLLSLVLIKPVVSDRIMEIDLTTSPLSVSTSKGKHWQQDTPKKDSAIAVKEKPPVIHKTTPAKRVLPKPVQKVIKTLSHDHASKTSPVVDDTAKKAAPDLPETTSPSTTAHRGAGQHSRRSYFAAVLARIEEAKQYPPSAVRRHIEGNAVVTFRLAPDGQLLFTHLQRTSGYHMLDQAALAAVQDAAPFPGFTDTADIQPRSMNVTISFVLKH